MPKDVHFDIPVDNPDRAQQFYSRLFGWKAKQVSTAGDDYWLLKSVQDESLGGMLKRTSSSQYPVNFFSVNDIDAAVKQVVDLGGEVVVEKKAIPHAGYGAQVTDTEGNVLGLWQNDPAAR